MKICTKCGEEKSPDEFGKDSSKKDGLYPSCKPCKRSKQREVSKAYYGRNREMVLAKQADNSEQLAVYNHEYYETHRTELLEYQSLNYLEDPEYYKNKTKEYCKTDIGRANHNSANARRRAKKIHATPPWSEVEAINEFYRNCPLSMVVDHIIPLQGDKHGVCGLHVLDNLQYLTPEENSRKSNKFYPEEHLWIKGQLKVA